MGAIGIICENFTVLDIKKRMVDKAPASGTQSFAPEIPFTCVVENVNGINRKYNTPSFFIDIFIFLVSFSNLFYTVYVFFYRTLFIAGISAVTVVSISVSLSMFM